LVEEMSQMSAKDRDRVVATEVPDATTFTTTSRGAYRVLGRAREVQAEGGPHARAGNGGDRGADAGLTLRTTFRPCKFS
jgi:hypothetical protein